MGMCIVYQALHCVHAEEWSVCSTFSSEPPPMSAFLGIRNAKSTGLTVRFTGKLCQLAFVQCKPRISLGVWSWKFVWVEFDLQHTTQRWVHDDVCCMSDSKMLKFCVIVCRYVYGLSQNSLTREATSNVKRLLRRYVFIVEMGKSLYNSFVRKPRCNKATGRWKVHMEQSPSWEVTRFSASQVIFPHFMETQGLLPHLQEPATCPYSQPDQSTSCPPSHVLMIHFNITLPSTTGPSKWSLDLRFPYQNPVCTSLLPHTCYVHRQSRSSRFDHPNNVWCCM
jgi:hypothetical protein